MPKVIIYALCCPVSHSVRYIGQTNDLESRLSNHISEIGLTEKNKWITMLSENGLKPYALRLEEIDEDSGNEAELFWINLFKSKELGILNNLKYMPRYKKPSDLMVPVDTKTYVIWKSKQSRKDLQKLGLLLNVTVSRASQLINKRKLTPDQFRVIDEYFKTKKAA